VHLQIIIIIIIIIVFARINISRLRTLFDDTHGRLSDVTGLFVQMFSQHYTFRNLHRVFARENISHLSLDNYFKEEGRTIF